MVGTAYFAWNATILTRIAGVLGKHDDAVVFEQLAKDIRSAFQHEYVAPSGRLVGDTQTAYALALMFDLLPEDQRAQAVDRLVDLIDFAGNHLSTGFVGTPLLCPVLTRFGRSDVAYQLLQQETYPSWLYSVLQGATTIWERWNSYTKEKGFSDIGMNSFNHYAYGAVGHWMYSTVAGLGLDPDKPGGRDFLFAPQPGGTLTHARTTWQSPYGSIACGWEKTANGEVTVAIEVPANVRWRIERPENCAQVTVNGTVTDSATAE
jgi:alpha-L-rhamnosidase